MLFTFKIGKGIHRYQFSQDAVVTNAYLRREKRYTDFRLFELQGVKFCLGAIGQKIDMIRFPDISNSAFTRTIKLDSELRSLQHLEKSTYYIGNFLVAHHWQSKRYLKWEILYPVSGEESYFQKWKYKHYLNISQEGEVVKAGQIAYLLLSATTCDGTEGLLHIKLSYYKKEIEFSPIRHAYAFSGKTRFPTFPWKENAYTFRVTHNEGTFGLLVRRLAKQVDHIPVFLNDFSLGSHTKMCKIDENSVSIIGHNGGKRIVVFDVSFISPPPLPKFLTPEYDKVCYQRVR